MTEPTAAVQQAAAHPPTAGKRLWIRSWWLWVLAAVAAAYASSPGFGFLGDARFLLESNRLLQEGGLGDQLTHDYFWSSSGNTIPYWRPITKGSWWLERRLLGSSAAVFHLVQVGWHLLATAAAMGLARSLGAGRAAAAAAGLMFGLGPAAAEPVCLLMARSDVVACACSAIALWGWHRHLARGSRRWLVLHLVAAVAALGSKETSVVLAPTLMIWAGVRVAWGRMTWRSAALAVLPILVLSALMLGLRAAVLGDRPGAAVAADPTRIFVGAARYVLAVAPLRLATGLRNVSYDEATSVASVVVALVAWAAVVGVGALFVRRKDAAGLALLCWAAGTLAPVLLVEQMNVPNVIGKFPMADRWALPASLAVAVLFAARLAPALPPRIRTIGGAAVLVWGALALLSAPGSHGVYASEISLLDKEDADFDGIPAAYRTLEDRCRHTDRQVVRLVHKGRWSEVVAAGTRTVDCPADLLRDFNMLSALTRLERWPQALALSDDLLARSGADTRHMPMLQHLRGRTLLALDRPQEAVGALQEAVRLGLRSCGVAADLVGALSRAGKAKQAASLRAQTPHCRHRE